MLWMAYSCEAWCWAFKAWRRQLGPPRAGYFQLLAAFIRGWSKKSRVSTGGVDDEKHSVVPQATHPRWIAVCSAVGCWSRCPDGRVPPWLCLAQHSKHVAPGWCNFGGSETLTSQTSDTADCLQLICSFSGIQTSFGLTDPTMCMCYKSKLHHYLKIIC